jgi:hypothetical protein
MDRERIVMAVKKKALQGDTTRTERAKAHLERLEKARHWATDA